MRAVGQPDRSRSTADFLHGHAVRQVAEVAAAILFLHGDAEQAEIAHFHPQVRREQVVAVDLGGARRDLRARELVDRLAQHLDVFAEVEIQGGKMSVHLLLSPVSLVRFTSRFERAECLVAFAFRLRQFLAAWL